MGRYKPGDFLTGVLSMGDVSVYTSNDGGHPPEFWTERLVSVILCRSDNEPENVKARADAYQAKLEATILRYMKQAIISDRSTLAAELRRQGHEDIARIIGEL